MFALFLLKLKVEIVKNGVLNKILNVITLKIMEEEILVVLKRKRDKIWLKMDVSNQEITKFVLVVSSKVNQNLYNLKNLNHLKKNQKLK